MRFVSTRGAAGEVSLSDALFSGTAPDGGLWIPAALEPLSEQRRAALLEGSADGAREWLHPARILAAHFFGEELDRQRLDDVVAQALSFPMPLRRLDERRWLLELFRGPTLAFKDVAARTMARLMAALIDSGAAPAELLERPSSTVLVATSGDTGAAVAHAFAGLARFEVVVLFPHGQVSEAQRRLFSTLGANVRVGAVQGTFDDCQRLVKEAFADRRLRREHGLLSANSINIGRLLPQTFYYAHLARVLRAAERPLVVSVPSGNFGNLTAGLIARAIGVPIDRFIASTNINDVVPEFLRSGRFEPRPSLRTLSNAMDVGNPSNLERMRWLLPELSALRQVVSAFAFDDERTLRAMVEVAERYGAVLDPHTAVGLLGLERGLTEPGTGVALATAHPAKFEDVLGRAGLEVPTPTEIRDCFERAEEITALDAHLGSLADWLGA